MMGVSLYQSMQFFKGNRITAGVDWFRYGGKAWNEYVSGEPIGTTSDLVNKHENELAGYVDLRQNHVLDWNGCHKQDWLFICPIRSK